MAPFNVLLISTHQLWLSGIETLLNEKSSDFFAVNSLRFQDGIVPNLKDLASNSDVVVLEGLDDAFDFLEQLQAYESLKVVVVTDTQDQSTLDHWVLLGVRGVLGPDTTPDQFQKALLKVSEGELWLDRFTTSRIVSEISHKKRIPTQLVDEKNAIERLTDREKNILQAIVSGEGLALRDIAQSLYISEFTLRNHLTAIYSKLGVKNRLGLYVFGQAHFARRDDE